jgi:hypothetical protein
MLKAKISEGRFNPIRSSKGWAMPQDFSFIRKVAGEVPLARDREARRRGTCGVTFILSRLHRPDKNDF